MSAYDALARFYDLLTDDVEYERRGEYIHSLLKEYGAEGGIMLDLSCGTGTLTEFFWKKGYDMIGVDKSPEMLMKARQKFFFSGCDALLLCQDMRELDLYGTVDCAICTLDSINHLPTIEDVSLAFSRVSLFMNKGGVFVFDVNTEYKHREILGDNTFVMEEDDVFVVWQNFYEESDKSTDIRLDIFTKNGELYESSTEDFTEWAYSTAQLKAALENNGFEVKAVYDDLTRKPERADSERLYFAAVKI
ncbi:MAG: class I SAM-dependent methyltransferase [Clostridiales bacterium]|nr:class I SAM-dependent methyltransferase [Clostridiales bacterium]